MIYEGYCFKPAHFQLVKAIRKDGYTQGARNRLLFLWRAQPDKIS